MSWMCQSRSITSRFRLPCSKETAESVIRSALRAEVKSRRMQFEMRQETAEIISKVADILTSESHKFGIMFSGQCGNGKTTMVKAISGAVRYFALLDKLGNFSLSLHIVGAKTIATENPEAKTYHQRLRLLAIEDMGNEPAEYAQYGNISSPLADVIEYRYDNQLFTVITTNLTPPQITEKYGVRIADRFREMLDVIVFEGGSFRK